MYISGRFIGNRDSVISKETPVGAIVIHSNVKCKLVNKGKSKYQLKEIRTGRVFNIYAPR